jgi:hypothetical protein
MAKGSDTYWEWFGRGVTAREAGTCRAPVPGTSLDVRQGWRDGHDWAGPGSHAHSAYPHEPGRLPGCKTCQARCHCTPGTAECVFVGEHTLPVRGSRG